MPFVAFDLCRHPRCFMHSNSAADADRKEADWCDSCVKKFQINRSAIFDLL
jgi:predicted Zn-dependent protease